MLALEDVLLLLAVGVGVFFIGRMFYREYTARLARTRNPLEQAKERLRLAEMEAEAAKLNERADKIIDGLYADAIDKPAAGPRVAVPDDEADRASDEPPDSIKKGKGHHG
jgi:hypothetical protein